MRRDYMLEPQLNVENRGAYLLSSKWNVLFCISNKHAHQTDSDVIQSSLIWLLSREFTIAVGITICFERKQSLHFNQMNPSNINGNYRHNRFPPSLRPHSVKNIPVLAS